MILWHLNNESIKKQQRKKIGIMHFVSQEKYKLVTILTGSEGSELQVLVHCKNGNIRKFWIRKRLATVGWVVI